MAKLECTIKREGGTVVEVEGIEYHFKPQADGAHVAEVGNIKHIGILTKITEAYGPYKGSAQAIKPQADDATVTPPVQIAPGEGPVDFAAGKADALAQAPTPVLTPAQKAAATKAAKAAAAKGGK